MLKFFEESGEKNKASYKNKFWQTGNHAIELYSEAFAWQKSNYINEVDVLEDVSCFPAMLQTIK